MRREGDDHATDSLLVGQSPDPPGRRLCGLLDCVTFSLIIQSLAVLPAVTRLGARLSDRLAAIPSRRDLRRSGKVRREGASRLVIENEGFR